MVTFSFDTRVSELNQEAKMRYNQAATLLAKPDCSAEDMTTAEALSAEGAGLKARASQLVKLKLDSSETVEQQAPVQGNAQAGEFKNFAEFIGAMTREIKSRGRDTDARLQKDLAGTSGGTGGYLIPSQMSNEIMSVAAPMSVVRPRATIFNLTGRDVEFPQVDQAAITPGTTPFFGGVDTFWQAEGSTIAQTDPRFRQMKMVAHELVGRTKVNNSLLEDAPALASFLASNRGFPGAIAWREDYSFLRGSGVGQPLGVVNAPGTATVTRNTGMTIKFDDLVAMEAKLLGEQAVWVASISTKTALMLMNGPTGNPAYLWGSARDGVPNMLMGRPILFTDKMPALGTKGDIMLADFSYYMIADRNNGQTIESDASESFSSNKTVMRIIHRVDGQPWLSAPITYDGTNTVSPFVVLV